MRWKARWKNIVRNALRYSHTKISVSFSVDKDGITVNVDDDGPGVSPEDREQIFPSVLSYRRGLAIASPAAPVWGWRLSKRRFSNIAAGLKADDSPLGGLRLTIWLPLYKRTLTLSRLALR